MHTSSIQIDTAFLERGSVPSSFPLDLRTLIFLWQAPHPAALAWLRATYPDALLLAGRFDAETRVCEAGLEHLCPSDFISAEALIRLEIETFDRRRSSALGAMPCYRGMPLVDGDLNRSRIWFEMVSCAASLMLIRRACPKIRLITDWMGARLARSTGMPADSPWQVNAHDPHWPARRTVDAVRSWIDPRRRSNPRADRESRSVKAISECDVLAMLGGWVESRFLEGFPLREMTRAGFHCLTLAHRRSEALDRFLDASGSAFVEIAYPEPQRGQSQFTKDVAAWCDRAAEAGYFWPFCGDTARRLVRLMRWPRWSGKLVAMHRRMTEILDAARPKLVLTPAEKDWGPYCMMHAAREAGIPCIGIKHASWMAGSRFDRLENGLYFPSAARHILAYTPMDERVAHADAAIPNDLIVWRGNPRMDKRGLIRRRTERYVARPNPPAPDDVMILFGARGIGGGRTIYLRRSVLPWNRRLMRVLFDQLNDNVHVRLHPWDSPENYPPEMRGIILETDEALEACLARTDALVTTYSTIALDAAAAGIPVFLWDHMNMALDECEIARHGAALVDTDLNRLCGHLVRFREDPAFRSRMERQARQFSEFLHGRSNGAAYTSDSLTRWFVELMVTSEATGESSAGDHHVMEPAIPPLF